MHNVDHKRARHFEVDLSPFSNILEIDKEILIINCESLVNITQFTRAMVPMNLALAVVLELDDLTVGGLLNGRGLEGRSHIYLAGIQVEAIRNYYHDMHVLQDLLVPLHKVSDALEWANK
ncbi:putative delta(24)-sterol reductase [Helianthus debilis subsp. tardiflorus]